VSARAPWVLAVCTAAFAIGDVVFIAATRPLLSQETIANQGFPFAQLSVVGSALLGAVILDRYERHAVGVMLTFVGIVGSFSLMTEAYHVWVVNEGGPGPTGPAAVAGWVSSITGGQLAFAGLAILFLVAPDGHFLTRRWRWVAAAIAVGALACAVAVASTGPVGFDLEEQQAGGVRGPLFTFGFVLIVGGLVASLVSMWIRLRRSVGEERQQLRLVGLAVAALILGIANVMIVEAANGGRQTVASSLPLFVAYLLLPVLFGLAALRYRLYDIEVVINRSVVLAVGLAFAGVGYTTVVVLVGTLVDTRTDGLVLSLLTTAGVAVAFQPLRRWVVRLADRLAYGRRARPHVALSDFSRRLAETPTPETLLPAVAGSVAQAVSARGATVSVAVAGSVRLSASVGETTSDRTTPYDVPVRHGSEPLGNITVHVPRGRSLRPSDARLLQALADQAAVAFRNMAIEAQLAEHVAGLDRTTRQLVDSRARIIDADDEARRTLDAAIARDVLPSLEALPARLRRARAAVTDGTTENGLEDLVRSVNTALESLRELTRGVFPTQLARNGLEPTLRSLLSRQGLVTALALDPVTLGRRFPARVESTVYFCCAEAARGMSERSLIELTTVADQLQLRISGVAHGTIDLQAVGDRVAAVDGSLSLADSQLLLSIPIGVAGRVDALAGGVPDL
jgi:hypothetical protein